VISCNGYIFEGDSNSLFFAIKQNETPLLSPLPKIQARQLSPYRRISQSHSVYVSPLKIANIPASPNRHHTYSFARSPAKDLKNINQMMKQTSVDKRTVSKRIFQDDSDPMEGNKKVCTDPPVMRSKIQSIFSERGVSGDASNA
jgi:hypothetical protein